MSGRWRPRGQYEQRAADPLPQAPARAPSNLKVTIYHNADCTASRNALEAIRAAGHDPVVIEYLKTPLRREEIAALIALAKLSPQAATRTYETEYRDLGLEDREPGDDEMLDVLTEHPQLLNRPFVTVVQDSGEITAALCRPSEKVNQLLQTP